MRRAFALVLMAVLVCGTRGYTQESTPGSQEEKNRQEMELIKKQLEDQQKTNEALMRRLSTLEEQLQKQEQARKDQKSQSGTTGEPYSITSSRPDGKRILHRETPWADGEVTYFNYLDEGMQGKDQDDLPIGLYYGSKSSFAEFHGFANFEVFDFGREGAEGGRSNFDLHQFYLSARAEIRSNLYAFLEIEYEHGREEIGVDRAFIEWKLARELGLQFGLRFAPFGIDKQLTILPPLKNSISTPAVLDEFVHSDWPAEGMFAVGTIDMPVSFKIGKGSALDYTLGLMNGEDGLDRDDGGNKPDNNSNKSAVVNIGFSPFIGDETLGSARIGFSHLFNHRYDADQTGSDGLDARMTGVDMMWDFKGAHARFEYVTRTADDDPVNGIEGDGNGYYIEVAYDVAPYATTVKLPFSEKDNFNLIRPFIRYNKSDTPLASSGFTTGVAGEELKRWDYGILVSPYPHFKFRLEYQNAQETTPDGVEELNNNGILGSVTVDF